MKAWSSGSLNFHNMSFLLFCSCLLGVCLSFKSKTEAWVDKATLEPLELREGLRQEPEVGTIGHCPPPPLSSPKSALSPNHARTVLALWVDRLRTAVPVSCGVPWTHRQ